MKIRGSSEVEEVRVELVPLIDAVFLLLIFFMCSSTMSRVDITPEVQLPVAPKAAVPEEFTGRGRVNILPTGTPTATGELVSEEKPFMVFGSLVDDAGLEKTIIEQVKQTPGLKLYLRVDKDTQFALVRRAIAACARAGVFDVIFASYPSTGDTTK